MSDQKNLYGVEAIEKIQDMVDENRFAMLCTNPSEFPISTCPMSVQEVDADGTIWFFSAADSDHNADLKKDSRAQLIFAKPSDSEYLSLAGKMKIWDDHEKVGELWNKFAEAWFPEGKNDPNLSLLRFRPEEGQFWDTKNGKIITLLKYAASAVTDEEADIGVKGSLTV